MKEVKESWSMDETDWDYVRNLLVSKGVNVDSETVDKEAQVVDVMLSGAGTIINDAFDEVYKSWSALHLSKSW